MPIKTEQLDTLRTLSHSQVCDCSDVIVKTPNGDIPWSILRQLNEVEMKILVIDLANPIYLLLRILSDEEVDSYLIRTLNQQYFAANSTDLQ